MPEDINSIFGKGKEQFSKKKYSSALGKFNQVVQMDPDFELGWVYKVRTHNLQHQSESAFLAVNKALGLHNSNAELWRLKAGLLAIRGDSTYEETLNCCKEALRLNPNAYWYDMARIHDRFRHYKEGIDCIDKALAIEQNSINLWRLKLAFKDALEYGKNYFVPLSSFAYHLLLIPPTDKIIYTTWFKVKYSYTTFMGKVKVKKYSTVGFLTNKGIVFNNRIVEWKYIRLKKKDGKLIGNSYVFRLKRNPIFESNTEFNARLEKFNNDLQELLKGFNILNLKKWKIRQV